MAASLSVNISGSLLSSLFYEHVNASGDQEGFLLGEVVSHITDTISDSQISGEKEETCLNIYTIVPCRELFSFYDSKGHLDEDRLENILQGRQKNVIGWYKFRRNTTLEVSLREHVVHNNLCNALSTYDKFFIFGLFTSCVTSNDATHSFDHVFLRSTGIKFEAVPLKVINLGDTSHSEYRIYPPTALNIHCGHFGEVLGNMKHSSLNHDPTVSQIQNVHTALQSKLGGLQDEVGDTEAIIASMTLEMSELQSRLACIQSLRGALLSENEDLEITEVGETPQKNYNVEAVGPPNATTEPKNESAKQTTRKTRRSKQLQDYKDCENKINDSSCEKGKRKSTFQCENHSSNKNTDSDRGATT